MNRTTYLIPILLSLLLMSPVQAEVSKIVGLSEAVEADKIHVILDKHNKKSGSVIVTGCESCPMDLKLLPTSKLYYQNKKISRKKAWKVSGKSGTVFYDKWSKFVKKIKW